MRRDHPAQLEQPVHQVLTDSRVRPELPAPVAPRVASATPDRLALRDRRERSELPEIRDCPGRREVKVRLEQLVK